MKKSTKGLLLLLIQFAIGFLCGFLLCRSCTREPREAEVGIAVSAQPESPVPSAEADAAELSLEEETQADSDDDVDGTGESVAREVIYYGPRLAYAKLFADLNDAHVSLAKQIGLPSVPQTRDELSGLSGLVELKDNDYYVVDELRYSMPYLTNGAARELMDIAVAFSDSLKSKKLLDYKLVVSSLLRTEEDVKRLRRSGNPNASDNSAHCYGTTFDITYTRYLREDESEEFMQPYELTKVLGEVLLERKKAGKCLVKYEKKEHCFHITANY